jgi:hypothetical protein
MTSPLSKAAAAALVALLGTVAGAARRADASSVTVHIGPPSVGKGGANPVSFPPVNPIEYELVYVTDNDWEGNLGVTPGLLVGRRSEGAGGSYVSFGGGYVQSFNGGGPGIYSSLGIDTGGKVMKFNAEIKQAVGYDFAESLIVSPYAIRIGATVLF